MSEKKPQIFRSKEISGKEKTEEGRLEEILPERIKEAIFKKYSSEEVICCLDIEKVVEHFLQEKHLKIKAKDKERIIEILNNWQKGMKK